MSRVSKKEDVNDQRRMVTSRVVIDHASAMISRGVIPGHCTGSEGGREYEYSAYASTKYEVKEVRKNFVLCTFDFVLYGRRSCNRVNR